VAPEVAKILPATQGVQLSEVAVPVIAGPQWPLSQVQAALADDPAAEMALLPQVLQSSTLSTSVAAGVLPERARYLPAAQSAHTESPVPWAYLPPWHTAQVSDVAPEVAKILPATQGVQLSEVAVPVIAGPQWPLSQVQAALADDPAAEMALLPQEVHEAAPAAAEYLPATQFTHVPVVEVLPTAQLVQLLAAIRPVAVDVLPAAQLVQTDKPVVAANLPAAQLSHALFPPVAVILPTAQALQVVAGTSKNLPGGHAMQVDWYGYATLFVDAHGSAYCPEQPFTPCVTIATKFGKVSLSAVTPVLR